jgi:uroporphyrinogen decarboxylase
VLQLLGGNYDEAAAEGESALSTMTSRDRVLAAFAHQEPDRVPAWCGASPEFIAKAKRELNIPGTEELFVRFGDDFRRVYARYNGPEFPLSPSATSRTVFGIEREGYGYGQPMAHPLANATLAQVHGYSWPEPRWMDVSQIRKEVLAWNRRYAILGGDWSPFWHDAIDLMGMERLLFAMYDQPEIVDELLAHIVDFYFAVTQRVFESAGDAIDIFFLGNDFGSQTGALISEGAFRRFIFPHLERLARLGHDYGLKVMMHCCGNFASLMPAMIEARLDGLQALQPCGPGMEPERLKSDFGHQLVFAGCIDSHHVLIEGTPDSVSARTREVLEIMKPGGGYVLSASHDYILEETPVENVLAMFDVAREYRAG